MQQASDKSIIVSEILDSRTRNLVSVSKISDYVLSNELVSMALAMVAEDKQINRVLEELFAEEVLSKMQPYLDCALILRYILFHKLYLTVYPIIVSRLALDLTVVILCYRATRCAFDQPNSTCTNKRS